MTVGHTTIKTIGTGECTKTNTMGHTLEIATGEAHHHALDTHHLLRMVNHQWDSQNPQSQRVLILGMGRLEQELI